MIFTQILEKQESKNEFWIGIEFHWLPFDAFDVVGHV